MTSWMRVLSLLLPLTLSVPLAACGDDSSNDASEGGGDAGGGGEDTGGEGDAGVEGDTGGEAEGDGGMEVEVDAATCAATCENEASDFEGEWSATAYCPGGPDFIPTDAEGPSFIPTVIEDPGFIEGWQESCADITGSATTTIHGATLTVSGGSYTATLSRTSVLQLNAPLDCDLGSACEGDIFGFGDEATCAVEDDVCTCTYVQEDMVEGHCKKKCVIRSELVQAPPGGDATFEVNV